MLDEKQTNFEKKVFLNQNDKFKLFLIFFAQKDVNFVKSQGLKFLPPSLVPISFLDFLFVASHYLIVKLTNFKNQMNGAEQSCAGFNL